MEPTKPSSYIPQIDIIRAFAFLLVVLVHFTVPTWNSVIPNNQSFPREVMESLIRQGWLGVSLFLFISGYSLSIGKTGINSPPP